MKPGVVGMVLHDAAGDAATTGSASSTNSAARARPQADFAVDHAQPIGSGCAGQEIRLIGESPAVGQVVHEAKVQGPRSKVQSQCIRPGTLDFGPGT